MRKSWIPRLLARYAALLGVAMLAALGCAARSQRYTPAPQTARASLEAALNAWREGVQPESSEKVPAVQFVDTTRLNGQTLRSFEVLSETTISGEGRAYVVRLTLDNPSSELRARYVVVGIDPIWVFRKEDYDRLAHWEHPMSEVGEGQEDSSSSKPSSAAPVGVKPQGL